MTPARKDIRTLSKDELRAFFKENDIPVFKGNQVYEWLWRKAAQSFDVMTNLSVAHRKLLDENFVINHIEVDQQQKSNDGTIKNAVRLHDGLVVESVLIPTATRTTACVSSQVGCSLDCTFCATARLKRMRNLNPDEIFDQVAVINKQSLLYHDRPLSNVVFMGMGEPLINYKNTLAAIDKITSPEGLGMSPKRITVSTSGVSKMIAQMADGKPKWKLAVSLHSAIEETRNKIMPFTKKFPLVELKAALLHWYAQTQSKVTFEYVVWEGINDNQNEIDALVKFCLDVPSKVNLIEYNPIDESDFHQASEGVVNRYIEALEQHKIAVTVRRSRGKDIDAACGQLANKPV